MTFKQVPVGKRFFDPRAREFFVKLDNEAARLAGSGGFETKLEVATFAPNERVFARRRA
jgi:hypothetical protein